MGLQVSDLVGGSEGGDGLDATQQGTCDIRIYTTVHAVMMMSCPINAASKLWIKTYAFLIISVLWLSDS
jgi:hypothetical protein